MADVKPTYDKRFTNHEAVSWAGINSTDNTAEIIEIPKYSDKTVHVFGTFGGATVTIEGSNDPIARSDPGSASWITLVDPQGNNLSFTAAAMETLLDNPVFLRWSISGETGTTDLSVVISAKRTP